jgi:hypothetical protein
MHSAEKLPWPPRSGEEKKPMPSLPKGKKLSIVLTLQKVIADGDKREGRKLFVQLCASVSLWFRAQRRHLWQLPVLPAFVVPAQTLI